MPGRHGRMRGKAQRSQLLTIEKGVPLSDGFAMTADAIILSDHTPARMIFQALMIYQKNEASVRSAKTSEVIRTDDFCTISSRRWPSLSETRVSCAKAPIDNVSALVAQPARKCLRVIRQCVNRLKDSCHLFEAALEACPTDGWSRRRGACGSSGRCI